jgi:hypothetical protein
LQKKKKRGTIVVAGAVKEQLREKVCFRRDIRKPGKGKERFDDESYC